MYGIYRPEPDSKQANRFPDLVGRICRNHGNPAAAEEPPMIHPHKICPRCGQPSALTMMVCQRCGHQFRTQFQAGQTLLGFQTQLQARKRRTCPRWLSWVGIVLPLAFAGLVACVWAFHGATMPALTVEELLANNIDYNGREVRLRGHYLSWSGSADPDPHLARLYGYSTSSEVSISPDPAGMRDDDELELTGVYNAHIRLLVVSKVKVLSRAPQQQDEQPIKIERGQSPP